MDEIALHILDIVYNSIEAGATTVELEIVESTVDDLLRIRVADNGRGMDPEMLQRALDPFATSRTTRKVGLGLSLLSANAEASNGHVSVESEPGRGTVVTAVFQASHIDRPPLGNMHSTLLVIAASAPQIDLRYRHERDGKVFVFSTGEIRAQLGDVPLTHPEVLHWLDEFIARGLRRVEWRGSEGLITRHATSKAKGADKHAKAQIA